MMSRFGLKDVVVLAATLGVGVLVVLAMYQEDRRWAEARAAREAIREQTAALAQLERRVADVQAALSLQQTAIDALRNRPAAPPALPAPLAPRAAEPSTPAIASASPEWARAGAPVVTPPAWDVASDPALQPGFAEGGTLTEILEGQTERLTPYLAADTFHDRIVAANVLESLAAYDSRTLELRGWLAQAWQQDPDGLWLRVKIRDEARFSDGSPVTASDVVFTFMDYVKNPQIHADALRATFSVLTDVKEVAPRVVEFTFAEPRFNNLVLALRNPIIPRAFYSAFSPEQLNTSTGLLMGSGPYRLETIDPAAQWSRPNPVTLVRNERYWGRRTPVDTLRFLFVPDAAARLTEFDNQNADIVRATPDQFAARANDPQFNQRARALAWTHMRSGYAMVAWNCGERNGVPSVLADKRVRQAMALITDRARVNRDFYAGLGTLASGPFPPSQSDPQVQPLPFDVDRAAALLDTAGWTDRDGDGVRENDAGRPLAFEFTFPSASNLGEKFGKYLTDQAARVGVRVTLRSVDAAGLRAIQQNRDFDAISAAWAWSNPEIDPHYLHSSQIASGDNWGAWSNPRADELIDQARRTIDPARRAELWRELHRLIADEQPYMFVIQIPWVRFVSSRVQNVNPYPVTWDRREFFIPKDLQ